MVATLVNDPFENEPPMTTAPLERHDIVYGNLGWTDAVDDATLDLLVRAGVIVLSRTITGPDFETRVYVSVEGDGPR